MLDKTIEKRIDHTKNFDVTLWKWTYVKKEKCTQPIEENIKDHIIEMKNKLQYLRARNHKQYLTLLNSNNVKRRCKAEITDVFDVLTKSFNTILMVKTIKYLQKIT